VADIKVSSAKGAVKFPHVWGHHFYAVFAEKETWQNPVAL